MQAQSKVMYNKVGHCMTKLVNVSHYVNGVNI
jgi:hypothetical protein